MNISLIANQSHLKLESYLNQAASANSIELDLGISNFELRPGSFVAIVQFLATLHRNNATSKIKLKEIDSIDHISKNFHKYSIAYAWVLLINSREERYHSKIYSSAVKYFETLESVLAFKKKIVEGINDKYKKTDNVKDEFKTSFAIEGNKVEIGKGDIELIKKYEPHYRKIFSRRSNEKKTGSANFFQACFDHIPGFKHSTFLYSDENIIKSKRAIRNSFINVFDLYFTFNDPSRRNRDLLRRNVIYDHMSIIFYELIQNTHKWATYKDSEKISNLRGAYLNMSSLEDAKDSEDEIFNSYLNDIEELPSKNIEGDLFEGSEYSRIQIGKGPILFLELSIIDLGKGYPEVFLKKPLSEITLSEERKAIIDCFKRNITSDTGSFASLKGIGLAEVSKKLSEGNGFISIRTGRSYGYRNFIKNPLDIDKEIKNKDFRMEVKTGLTPIAGTSVSIFYPIELTK